MLEEMTKGMAMASNVGSGPKSVPEGKAKIGRNELVHVVAERSTKSAA